MRRRNGRPEQNRVFEHTKQKWEGHWSKLVLPYLPNARRNQLGSGSGSAWIWAPVTGSRRGGARRRREDWKLECEDGSRRGDNGRGRRSGRKSVIRPQRDAIVRHAPRDSLRGTVRAVGSTMDGGGASGVSWGSRWWRAPTWPCNSDGASALRSNIFCWNPSAVPPSPFSRFVYCRFHWIASEHRLRLGTERGRSHVATTISFFVFLYLLKRGFKPKYQIADKAGVV
jgi:hypothetical protein